MTIAFVLEEVEAIDWITFGAAYSIFILYTTFHRGSLIYRWLCLWQAMGGFPKLKGKAADIQWLLVPIHEILLELNDGSSHHRHRIRACKSLCDLFAIVRKNDSFLSEGVAKELEDSIELFLVHNNWLLERSLEEGDLLYCHSTKAHMMSHIGDLAKYQSPRAFWTYTWESFIGHVVQSAKSCLAGTPMQGVGKKILENYMLVLQIVVTREQPERL